MSLSELKRLSKDRRDRQRRQEQRVSEWCLPKLENVAEVSRLTEVDSETLWWLANERRSGSNSSSINAGQQFTEHYHSWWIRKRTTGWRLVEAPKPTLKFVQRRILELILDRVPPHPLSFGFVKGRSIIDFTKPHWRRECCLRLDLSDFFPSVSARRVFGMFSSFGYVRPVARLLTLLTTTQTLPGTLGERPSSDGCRQKLLRPHLPQGAPTSPALANLSAYQLDNRVAGMARSIGGVHYSRYADDLLLSGNRDFARRAQHISISIGAIALEEGFELNFRKTRVMRSSQRQLAAGMVMNDGANISRKKYDELKAILHNCVRSGPASQNRDTAVDFQAYLQGRVDWVTMLRPARGEKLKQLLSQIDWSK